MRLYYYSKLGTTTLFINNFFSEFDTCSILDCDTNHKPDTPFILFTPTYSNFDGSNAVPTKVKSWLMRNNHHKSIKGVVGMGDRFYGQFFCLASIIISKRYNIPLIHKVDSFGNKSDYDTINERLRQLCL